MTETVLLAYSGGLDTSCILLWLLEKGYDVVCLIADVGQDEDFEAARRKALKIGAKEVVVAQVKEDFVVNYIFPAVAMGLLYERRYLLGTSLARPCISAALVECAKQRGIRLISHGATGKGNDQVRFELSGYALLPDIQVIAPWRIDEFCQRFQGREDLLTYAQANGIEVEATPKAPWSMDANFMHISYESGVLENPNHVAPESLYKMTVGPSQWPDKPTILEVEFAKGLPVAVINATDKKRVTDPVAILDLLNRIGGQNGVGRIDIVENRFVGLKSRGVYETPGVKILFEAHLDLELVCLDREVLRLKSYLCDRMADFVYNGFWFSPEGVFARRCLEQSQEHVSGRVTMEIFKGVARPIARRAVRGLYNEELVSMNVHGGYTPASAGGFIEIHSIRLKEFSKAFGAFK
ncbi:argininosuccinate synthase [Phlebotomus argentipes]|uniref:argininosuccinate synthase n=1 Tax=Phlebotomus argentipes TaxID=94469 RepID=UPI0028933552|nr:argininosuccinate synthase [Phlebotomus argentipes]